MSGIISDNQGRSSGLVKSTGGGLTTASSWRLTAASANQTAAYFTSNWEEVDAPTGFSVLGTSMTESSGIFTFPSTGHWLIMFQGEVEDTNGGDAILRAAIYTTHNDTSYSIASVGAGIGINYGKLGGLCMQYLFDVVDTANYKVQFGTQSNPHGKLTGDTDQTETGVHFIKLADT